MASNMFPTTYRLILRTIFVAGLIIFVILRLVIITQATTDDTLEKAEQVDPSKCVPYAYASAVQYLRAPQIIEVCP